MNDYAQARTKSESLPSPNLLLPSLLAVNSAALFALDHIGGIPGWIKAAAALFLAF
ncbi:MAG TPA: hypothetical protein VNA04_17505 [Thermoanaerobaculia bacterium]|nr:hypothetical protein [Thermoanaerobaculia bacterium]